MGSCLSSCTDLNKDTVQAPGNEPRESGKVDASELFALFEKLEQAERHGSSRFSQVEARLSHGSWDTQHMPSSSECLTVVRQVETELREQISQFHTEVQTRQMQALRTQVNSLKVRARAG